jgi:hypothetical protein
MLSMASPGVKEQLPKYCRKVNGHEDSGLKFFIDLLDGMVD